MCLVPLTGKIESLQTHKQSKRKVIHCNLRLPLEAPCLDPTHVTPPPRRNWASGRDYTGRLNSSVAGTFVSDALSCQWTASISNLINSSQCCLAFDARSVSAAVTKASWGQGPGPELRFSRTANPEQELNSPARAGCETCRQPGAS